VVVVVELVAVVVVVLEGATVVVVLVDVVIVVDEVGDVVVVVDVVVVPSAAQIVGSVGAPSSKSRQPSRSRSMPIRVPEPNGTHV
jgi:hypothetical protein